jgi:hypothetical protein
MTAAGREYEMKGAGVFIHSPRQLFAKAAIARGRETDVAPVRSTEAGRQALAKMSK